MIYEVHNPGYIRYIIDGEVFNPLHFGYIKSYNPLHYRYRYRWHKNQSLLTSAPTAAQGPEEGL
jgi:hypothetical protein